MIRVDRFAMAICGILMAGSALAQQRSGRGQQTQLTARQGAPIDLTGYWVAQITGDWRFRMVTPPKGDYTAISLKPEARKIADAWDPAKDEAAGEQCKAYGAPGLMRMPGRIHITWHDEQTLKLEMDAGSQTRLFYFGTPQTQGGDWQGVSKASWEYLTEAVTDTLAFNRFNSDRSAGGLKVTTTKMRPGYLRKNGVPYSGNAVMTEYFDRITEPNGDTYIIVSTTVDDPAYLNQPYMISTQFKKQADGVGWNPRPCTAR